MPFTVKIKASDHRVNTGAIEDAIKGTFAEVLSEKVEVYVNQFDDHTLCITVEREDTAATETKAELIARVREECANEEAFRRNLDGYCFDE